MRYSFNRVVNVYRQFTNGDVGHWTYGVGEVIRTRKPFAAECTLVAKPIDTIDITLEDGSILLDVPCDALRGEA